MTMYHAKKRFTLLIISMLSISLMASPAMAQKGRKDKDKNPPGQMKEKKGKKDKGKPEGKGKPEKEDKQGKGKADAPGQIKKNDGEHPGGKARGKKDKEKVKAFKKDDDFSKEELKHIERLSKINRIEALGKEKGNDALIAKAGELREKENQRHEKKRSKLNLKGDKKDKSEKGKPEGKGKPEKADK
jgi:hypothetical protein